LTDNPHSPLPKTSRLVVLGYLFAAPALLMLADVFHYTHHYLLANVVFKTALVVFVVASFGLTYLFPPNAKYFGLVGTGLVSLGAVMISAISTETLYQDLLAEKGYSLYQIREFESVLQSAEAVRVIYLPTGFAFPLGLVVLGIGIYRTKFTPNYIAIILCGGAVLHTISRFFDNLSFLLISEAVLLIASSLAGWFMWRYKAVHAGKN
jgi:hypothetical protein